MRIAVYVRGMYVVQASPAGAMQAGPGREWPTHATARRPTGRHGRAQACLHTRKYVYQHNLYLKYVYQYN